MKVIVAQFHVILFLFLLPGFLFCQCISTVSGLNEAISNLSEGDTIVICNGIWDNLDLTIHGVGTAASPIIIKSDTIGGVYLKGDSRIRISGSYIYLDGFIFQNDTTLNLSLIEFRTNSTTTCSNCQITNIKFDSYHPISDSTLKWVRVFGQNNTISHCSFLSKKSLGSCIVIERLEGSDTVPDQHEIHHNYFAHRIPENDTFNGQNGQDAIRIGFSGTSMSFSNSKVYNNYFFDWVGEVEIISNKAGGNQYYNNTFRNYSGTLTLRHGNYCQVYNNFFLTNNTFEKAGGIRVIGSHHKVYNNYIEGVNTGSSKAVGAINLSNGKPNSMLKEYFAADNAIVAFNTIVAGDKGIRIGTSVNTALTIPPDSILIAHNVFVECAEAIPIDSMSTGPFPFIGNDRQGGTWPDTVSGYGNDVASRDILSETPMNGFRRILPNSPAKDAGSVDLPFVLDDIAGKTRPQSADEYDSGAEEIGEISYNRPYNDADVSKLIGAGSGLYTRCNFQDLIIDNLSVSSGSYKTTGSILSKGIIKPSNTVIFNALNNTALKEDFHVLKGGQLYIMSEGCL